MANEYAVNQADLTAVADAIRAKGGTSGALTFPGGFVDAVGAIEAGGGGIELNISGKSVRGLVTFEVSNDEVTEIYGLNCPYISKMTFPNVTYIKSIQGSSGLESFTFENVEKIDNVGVQGCSKLKQVVAPKLTTVIGGSTFEKCTSLEYVRMDMIQSFPASFTFSNDGELKTVIMPSLTGFSGYMFNSCVKLNALVLGNTNSASIVPLTATTVFKNTPFVGYNGTFSGHVYVPSALIESYKTATNWATLYANYPEIFQPIEGSEYE